jgi:hypothetical protein
MGLRFSPFTDREDDSVCLGIYRKGKYMGSIRNEKGELRFSGLSIEEMKEITRALENLKKEQERLDGAEESA